MNSATKIEMTIFFIVSASVMLLWYHAWVKPADEMRYQIMSCMDESGDKTMNGYKTCKKELSP